MKDENMRKAVKGRIYPNNAVQAQLEEQCRLVDEVYNAMLSNWLWTKACPIPATYPTYRKINKKGSKNIGKMRKFDLYTVFETGKKTKPHWSGLDSTAATSAKAFIENAINEIGKPDGKGGRRGTPSLRESGWKQSYTSTQFTVKGNHLNLSKISGPVRWSREIPNGWKPKTVTISCVCGKWYASVSLEAVGRKYPALKTEGLELGVDVGARENNLAVAGDGKGNNFRFRNPQPYKKLRPLLGICQKNLRRSFSKHKPPHIGNCKNPDKLLKHYNDRWMRHNEEKKKGSKRHQRKLLRIQRIHKRIANQRESWHHLISRRLTDVAKAIGVETLSDIKSDKHLPKKQRKAFQRTLRDAAFHQLLWQLEYKSKHKGVWHVKAHRWYYSTKTCSSCGHVNDEQDENETFKCDKCGIEMNRDENAMINLHPSTVAKANAAHEEEKKRQRVKRVSRRVTVGNGGRKTAKNQTQRAGHQPVVGRVSTDAQVSCATHASESKRAGKVSPAASMQLKSSVDEKVDKEDCKNKYSNSGKSRDQVMTESHEALERQKSKPVRKKRTNPRDCLLWLPEEDEALEHANANG